jgi:hypothetical protein
MTDEFGSFLRDRLGAAGHEWAPTRPMETARAEVTTRIGKRRWAHRAIVTGGVAILAMALAAVHFGAGAASTHFAANPPGPVASRPGIGPGQGGGGPAAGPAGPAAANPGRAPAGGVGQPGHGPTGRETTTPVGSGPGGTVRSEPSTSTASVGGPLPSATSPTVTLPSPTTGPSPTGSPTTPPEPATTILPPVTSTIPTTTTAPGEYIFTLADTGKTESVPAGATIELALTSCPGTAWGPVRSSNPTVVLPQSATPNPATGSARVYLRAANPGRAVLRLSAVPGCPTTAASFRLTVDVTGNPTIGSGVMSTWIPDPDRGA